MDCIHALPEGQCAICIAGRSRRPSRRFKDADNAHVIATLDKCFPRVSRRSALPAISSRSERLMKSLSIRSSWHGEHREFDAARCCHGTDDGGWALGMLITHADVPICASRTSCECEVSEVGAPK